MQGKGQTFENQDILLDNGRFEDCVFRNCRLIYGGAGLVHMAGCSFDGVRWEFAGAAENTLRFMAALYQGAGEGGRQLIEDTFESIRKAPAAGAQAAAPTMPGGPAGPKAGGPADPPEAPSA